MLHFFTDPYKDELIYSAISRYHYYTGNIDFKDTLEELFDKRNIIPSLEIGSNIEVLAENIGGKYTADCLINNHTIYPFYSPFLPKKRHKQILKEIKFQDGKGLYAKIGIIAGSICSKKHIYYCPLCAKENIEKYGEAYIHREHQLQGVLLCHKHEIELKKYPISKMDVSRLEYIRVDAKSLDLKDFRIDKSKYQDKLLKIAKDAYYLLNQDFNNISKEKIAENYKNLLYERGLTTSSGRVKQRELYEEFINFYGKEFLELMESSIDIEDEFNWLKVATRDEERTVHPIRHLLLINFLRDDISKFFKYINYQYNPFGKAPWPCLNRVADHYKKKVVRTLNITQDYKTRVPVGTFICSCGFVYSRKGPDKTEQDKYKIGRIKSFGFTWENKLKSLLSIRKYGVREISRIMSCDTKTVIKYANRLGLISSINTEFKVCEVEQKSRELVTTVENKYKNDVINFINSNEGCTRQQLRNNLKKEYIWLYRHDKPWLKNNLPESIPRGKRNKSENNRVDWEKRDNEYLKLIKEKNEIMLRLAVPVRITKSSIGKSTGLLAVLEKTINKLPNTEKYLSEIIESVEEFQIRRCKNIINYKIDKGESIRIWEIQRIAGIRSEAFGRIKFMILEYIDSQNKGDIWVKKQ